MDMLANLASHMPALLTMPDWLQNLDGANLGIGLVTLIIGLLGVAYLVLVFVSTPQPQTESAEEAAYPVSDRFLVPVFLPIGVAIAVAVIILLMSQILLVVPESVATPIALFIAVFILVVCSMIANARRLPLGLVYAVICVPLIVLVVAGTAAGVYRVNQAQQAAAAAAFVAAHTPQTAPTEITTDNKFSMTAIIVPAGQAITLTQVNSGQAIHNWHVLDVKDDSGKVITTELTQPGQKSTVTFTISAPGTYHFQCDVHPTEMTGTLTVKSAS
jgi:plastocyanin